MIRKLWKKIRKWYQSHPSCLYQRQNPWSFILEQAQLANEQWYIEQKLASPARNSLSELSDG